MIRLLGWQAARQQARPTEWQGPLRLPEGSNWTQELKDRLKPLPSSSRLLGTEAFCTCEAPQMLIKRVPRDQPVQNVQPGFDRQIAGVWKFAAFAGADFT
jgi:hypothetical protein